MSGLRGDGQKCLVDGWWSLVSCVEMVVRSVLWGDGGHWCIMDGRWSEVSVNLNEGEREGKGMKY